MARIKNTFWQRNKYKLNGVFIVFTGYFLYSSLNPMFPKVWEKKTIGTFEVSPMPFNLDSPYLHHGVYTKDFFITINRGDVSNIRQAYLNIGDAPLPLNQLEAGEDGILHGSQHGQHAHAISPERLTRKDKLWLTLQDWSGRTEVISWDLAPELLE